MTLPVAIYLLRDPSSGLVRYIGKAANPKERFWRHLYLRLPTHCSNWICSLRARGLQPKMEIARWVPTSTWRVAERELIQFFRDVSPVELTNLCDGGECGGGMVGRTHSDATRAKMSAALKGKQKSIGHCNIMRDQRLGKKHSLEHCARISASLLGKKRTLAQRAVFSEAQRIRRAIESAASGRKV